MSDNSSFYEATRFSLVILVTTISVAEEQYNGIQVHSLKIG